MHVIKTSKLSLVVLGSLLAGIWASASSAQDAQLYSEFLNGSDVPQLVTVADGGGYFLSVNRHESEDDELRFWRVTGEDAVLVDTLELDSMSAYIPYFSIKADGSLVLIQHRVQRGLRGREERTELESWQPGRSSSLRSLNASEELFPCGIAFLGSTGELAECAVNNAANSLQVSHTRLDNRNRREFLHNWSSGLGGVATVEDFRADGEGQIQVLVTAPFADLNGCPTCTTQRTVVLRSQPDSQSLQHIQPHAFLEFPPFFSSFAFGNNTDDLFERRIGEFVYHTDCSPTCANQIISGSEPTSRKNFMLAGLNGLYFELHNSGLSAFLFSERHPVMVVNLQNSNSLAFALSEDRSEAVLITAEGVARIRPSAERLQAALEYSQGITMVESGFGSLGINRIIAAFELDPTYVNRNNAFPYVHALPILFEELSMPVNPVDAGRLFLKLYELAIAQGDGVIAVRSLFNHSLYALKAGQPAISRQTALTLRNFIAGTEMLSDERRALFNVWPDLIEALVFLEEGQDDAAYDLLAERGGLIRGDLVDAAIVAEYFPLTRILYKNKVKLAFLLNKTEDRVSSHAPVGILPAVPSDYPDVTGQIITAAILPGAAVPESPQVGNDRPVSGQVLD